MITGKVAEYYSLSASNHDRAYDKPERQQDLAAMRARVAEALRGHTVLELACGAAYWTAAIASGAKSVLATDISPAMIAMAKLRTMEGDKVRFALADAFDLAPDLGRFSAVFVGCFWSHILREQQERVLAHWRERFGKDVLLVLLDDDYVDGSSETVARTDAEGNTYQIRTVADGTRYEIPKNYPSDSTLRKRLAGATREIRIARLEHYWLLSCRLK